MAFDSHACCGEIVAQKGIEALLEVRYYNTIVHTLFINTHENSGWVVDLLVPLQLYQCPNKKISHQSVCALLNMSVTKEMRMELGRRGAIAILLSEI